jgi:hypothetical protein
MGSTFSGELFYVLLIAIVDAAILSWAALRWYQYAVSRRMRPARGGELSPRVDAPEPIEPLVGPPAADESLQVAVYHAQRVSNRRSGRREWPAGWRRTGAAYCVGAALFSAVVTAAAAAELQSVTPNALFGMWWMNAWPIVPTLILLLLLDRWSGLRLAAGYVMCGSAALALLTVGLQFWRGSFNSAPFTNMFYLNVALAATAWLPLLLVVASGWHRIRAVMPLALASTLFFGFGLLLFRAAIVRGFNAPATRDVLLELAVLTSTQIAYYSLYMLFALPAGWLAWRALTALATAFERKKFSDIQLVIDCWWLIVTAERIATHLVIPFGPAGIGIGLRRLRPTERGRSPRCRWCPTPRRTTRSGSCCCACSASNRAPSRCSTALRNGGAFAARCSSSPASTWRCGRRIRVTCSRSSADACVTCTCPSRARFPPGSRAWICAATPTGASG